MPDDAVNGQPAAPADVPVRCPWCSTESPAGTLACPSCGASLVATGDSSVPGLTAIDAAAVLRARNPQKGRGGILGFLSGETGDSVEVPSEAELERLAPPDADVRMEIMKLELEAARGRLAAEMAALAAEAAIGGADTPTGGGETVASEPFAEPVVAEPLAGSATEEPASDQS